MICPLSQPSEIYPLSAFHPRVLSFPFRSLRASVGPSKCSFKFGFEISFQNTIYTSSRWLATLCKNKISLEINLTQHVTISHSLRSLPFWVEFSVSRAFFPCESLKRMLMIRKPVPNSSAMNFSPSDQNWKSLTLSKPGWSPSRYDLYFIVSVTSVINHPSRNERGLSALLFFI